MHLFLVLFLPLLAALAPARGRAQRRLAVGSSVGTANAAKAEVARN